MSIKNKLFFFLVSFFMCCSLILSAQSAFTKQEVMISWYGEPFHGRPTSSGEIFNMNALTAAHKTLPFGTMLEITNIANGKRVIVRVNDRGPFVDDRELDVSRAAAQQLDMLEAGLAQVNIIEIASSTTVIASNSTPAESVVEPLTPPVTEPLTPSVVVQRELQPILLENKIAEPTWRIQLGAFAYEENAKQFVYKLRKQGFDPAFERTNTMIRVVLAHIPDASLEELKLKLSEQGHREYVLKKE